MDLNLFAKDPNKAEEGEWFQYDRSPGIEVKIASIESKEYERASERMRAAQARGSRAGLSAKQGRQIMMRCTADHLVKDWRGLTDGGSELPFSPDACYQIISDERYVDFYAWILNQATEIANFAEEELGEAEKN